MSSDAEASSVSRRWNRISEEAQGTFWERTHWWRAAPAISLARPVTAAAIMGLRTELEPECQRICTLPILCASWHSHVEHLVDVGERHALPFLHFRPLPWPQLS